MSYAYLVVVFAVTLFMSVFGLFGNIMVISAVRKHKELRTKHGILLSFLCLYQSLVLLLDLMACLRNLLEDVTDRWTCFYSLLPLSFFNNVQLVLILIISLDLAFLVLKPTKYNAIQLLPYTILVQIPCALFGMGLLTAGVVLVRPDKIISCDFIMAHPTELTLVRHLLVIGVCIATILVYAWISFIMWFKDWQNTHKTDGFCKVDPSLRYQRKMLRTLSVVMTAFICTSFASSVTLLAADKMTFLSDGTLLYVRSIAIKLGLISCAQNYYIYYKMSRDFQKAFKKIFTSLKKWRKEKLQLSRPKKVTLSAAFG